MEKMDQTNQHTHIRNVRFPCAEHQVFGAVNDGAHIVLLSAQIPCGYLRRCVPTGSWDVIYRHPVLTLCSHRQTHEVKLQIIMFYDLDSNAGGRVGI